MTDEPTPDNPDTPPTPEPVKTDRLPDEHPAAKALAKANEEAKALRLKLQEIEDRDKSDAEKLNERLSAAEQRAQDAEARAVRLEVATAKGLTPAQAKRLVGATREELEADADEILEAFPARQVSPPPSDKPRTDLRGGTDPTEDDGVDMREVVASIPRGI